MKIKALKSIGSRFIKDRIYDCESNLAEELIKQKKAILAGSEEEKPKRKTSK